jgi:hypothetical protein
MRALLEGLTRDVGEAEVLAIRVVRGIDSDGPSLVDAVRAARERVEQIQRIARALDIVDRLGRATAVLTDPAGVLADAEALVRGASARPSGFACELTDAPPVLTDAARLAHVLARLLSLAVDLVDDAMPPRVVARVVRRGELVAFEITARTENGRSLPWSSLSKLEVELCRHLVAIDGGALTVNVARGELVAIVALPALENVLPSERPTSRPRMSLKRTEDPSS